MSKSSFTGFRLVAAACQKRSIGGRKAGKIALLLSPTINIIFDSHINVRVPKYTTLWNSSLMAGLVGCAVVDIHSSFTGFRLLAAACQKPSIGGKKAGKIALLLSPTIHLLFIII